VGALLLADGVAEGGSEEEKLALWFGERKPDGELDGGGLRKVNKSWAASKLKLTIEALPIVNKAEAGAAHQTQSEKHISPRVGQGCKKCPPKYRIQTEKEGERKGEKEKERKRRREEEKEREGERKREEEKDKTRGQDCLW